MKFIFPPNFTRAKSPKAHEQKQGFDGDLKAPIVLPRHQIQRAPRIPTRKRPYVSDFYEIGAIAAEHYSPPMAISFGKSWKSSHIIAMSDEDGYLSLFDTRRKFCASVSHQENADKTKVCDWVAHHNTVFDICWIKDDTQIMTASGDQTIKVWDIQERKRTAVLMGHTGSVKSLCPHPTNPGTFIFSSVCGFLYFCLLVLLFVL
ncbi:hypothetical protein ACFX2I_023311 [Malus domestica]